MNNNTVAVVVIGAIVLLGGIALFMYSSPDATPTTTNNTTTVLPGGTAGTDTSTYSSTTTTTTTTSGTPLGVSKAATAVTGSTATLNGSVTANGAATTYWFEYSSDPLIGAGNGRSTSRLVLPAAAVQAPVYVAVAGLNAKTTYYFRLVTENSSGIVKGERISFATK